MSTTSQPEIAVYTLRVKREDLDRLQEIANAEHHTLAQMMRVLIEAKIAEHDIAGAERAS